MFYTPGCQPIETASALAVFDLPTGDLSYKFQPCYRALQRLELAVTNYKNNFEAIAGREASKLHEKWMAMNKKVPKEPTVVVMKAWEKPRSGDEKRRRRRSSKRSQKEVDQCSSDLHSQG